MSLKSLKLSKKGEFFTIRDIVEGHPLSHRLLELGLMAGEGVAVVHEAPMSADPIVIEVAGTRLALRRDEAALILVEEVSPAAGVK